MWTCLMTVLYCIVLTGPDCSIWAVGLLGCWAVGLVGRQGCLIETSRKLDLSKVLRLPRNLHLTLQKYCAEFKTCETFALPCQWARAPRVVRTWSETGPTRRRVQASFQLSGDANSPTGPCFLHISILPPHAHVYFLAGLLLLLSSVWFSWLPRREMDSLGLSLNKVDTGMGNNLSQKGACNHMFTVTDWLFW